MSDETALKKAELIMGPGITLRPGVDSDLITYRDGKPASLVAEFEGTHVRLKVTDRSEFSLAPKDDGYVILRGEDVFADNVGLVKMFCHSPHMAIVSLGTEGEARSTDNALSVLRSYLSTGDVRAISLHGGKTCTDAHYLEVVKAFRKECPDLPIGVSPEDFSLGSLKMFKDAGADEVKMTVRTFVPRLAHELNIDLEEVRGELRDAVSVFGRGKAVCTVYMGLGETMEEHLASLEELCKMGALPDTKVAKGPTRKVLKGRLGELAQMTPAEYAERVKSMKRIIKSHDLDPTRFNTMCYGCRLCTIVPFKDF